MDSIYGTLRKDLKELGYKYQLKNLLEWLRYDGCFNPNTRTSMNKFARFRCDEQDWSDFENAIGSSNHWLWRDEVIWTCIKYTFKGKSILNVQAWEALGEWYNMDIYLTLVAIITHRVSYTKEEFENSVIDESKYLETFGEAIDAYRNHLRWLDGAIKNRSPF